MSEMTRRGALGLASLVAALPSLAGGTATRLTGALTGESLGSGVQAPSVLGPGGLSWRQADRLREGLKILDKDTQRALSPDLVALRSVTPAIKVMIQERRDETRQTWFERTFPS